MTFIVLMASFNRSAMTLRALSAVQSQSTVNRVILVDDASTDGTPELVRQSYPDVQIVHSQGDLYWAASMALAERTALGSADHDDVLIWLNDDVMLDDDAFSRIELGVRQTHARRVLVGATRDPKTGKFTYGGFRRHGWHPLSFQTVVPHPTSAVDVDTFNGNVVAVPVHVALRIGGIDGEYSHALADIDYGMRVHLAGLPPPMLLPGFFGDCARNPAVQRSSIRDDWRSFTGVKGGGKRSSLRRYVNKFEPGKWPWSLLLTYGLWWTRRLSMEVNERTGGRQSL